jgi:hypothetical protein
MPAAMPRFFDTLVQSWDPVGALRASRLRVGKRVRAQGVPAILIGVSCIVIAAGVSRAIQTAAPALPDAFREGRNLWEAMRRRPLNP